MSSRAKDELEEKRPRRRRPKTKPHKPRMEWSKEDHRLFVIAVKKHKRDWIAVTSMVPNKTVAQVRSHAQKYFLKLQKLGRHDEVPPPRKYTKRKAPSGNDTSQNQVQSPKRIKLAEKPLEPKTTFVSVSGASAAQMPSLPAIIMQEPEMEMPYGEHTQIGPTNTIHTNVVSEVKAVDRPHPHTSLQWQGMHVLLPPPPQPHQPQQQPQPHQARLSHRAHQPTNHMDRAPMRARVLTEQEMRLIQNQHPTRTNPVSNVNLARMPPMVGYQPAYRTLPAYAPQQPISRSQPVPPTLGLQKFGAPTSNNARLLDPNSTIVYTMATSTYVTSQPSTVHESQLLDCSLPTSEYHLDGLAPSILDVHSTSALHSSMSAIPMHIQPSATVQPQTPASNPHNPSQQRSSQLSTVLAIDGFPLLPPSEKDSEDTNV